MKIYVIEEMNMFNDCYPEIVGTFTTLNAANKYVDEFTKLYSKDGCQYFITEFLANQPYR